MTNNSQTKIDLENAAKIAKFALAAIEYALGQIAEGKAPTMAIVVLKLQASDLNILAEKIK